MIELNARCESARKRQGICGAASRIRRVAPACARGARHDANETRESLTSNASRRGNHNMLCSGEWKGGTPPKISEVRMGTFEPAGIGPRIFWRGRGTQVFDE